MAHELMVHNRIPALTTEPKAPLGDRLAGAPGRHVPPERGTRDILRRLCSEAAAAGNWSRPILKDELRAAARRILRQASQPADYTNWTAIVLASELWRNEAAKIPFRRRLCLLPAETAEPNDFLGARVAEWRTTAEGLGYRVATTRETPGILRLIIDGHVDAVFAALSLRELTEAVSQILLAGIPWQGVPLPAAEHNWLRSDADCVDALLRLPHQAGELSSRTFLHLLRGAVGLFAPDEFERLVPRRRTSMRLSELNGQAVDELDPIASTEMIAYDFITRGGKHLRPFITLAVYDALAAEQATAGDAAGFASLPDGVKRAAMSIETFHKASLVHDDIEDDDEYRYGQLALHRSFGVPTAINVGDYLIGLGYRLVSRDAAVLGSQTAAEVLELLADAHQRLAEGQGAELTWRDRRNKRLTTADALRIYALKTSPAFEAAFLTGLRLAGPLADKAPRVRSISRNLGIAFQILNDLKDWQGDRENNRRRGSDLLGGRPTVLWALALENLEPEGQTELINLVDRTDLSPDERLVRARDLYEKAGVFEKAVALVTEHRRRAMAVAATVEPAELSRLLAYLIDSLLDVPFDEKRAVGRESSVPERELSAV
jgi:geranylgeranyl pyrophosphate synthase